MKVLQVSNLVSHHQLPLARELAARLGPRNFRFAATQAPDAERRQLGWKDDADEPWVLRAGERPEHRTQMLDWWTQADVVISGERELDRIEARNAAARLTFYASERWWKPPQGRWRMLHPRYRAMARRFAGLAASSSLHHLAIGALAAPDMRSLVDFGPRSWAWGYFADPAPSELPRPARGPGPMTVLWVGRMLDWKRVDTLIDAVAKARAGGAEIRLTLGGSGPERARWQRQATRRLGAEGCRWLDAMPAAQVPLRMLEHDVYVLPSTDAEGWGVVLNEAMASGCAVVSSRGAGAGPMMIEDGVDGLLFRPGDVRALAGHLAALARQPERLLALGQAARASLLARWTPAVAAERLLDAADALLSGREASPWPTGPMSRPAPAP